MRVVSFVLLLIFTTSTANAEEIQIFDMRKTLAMSDQDTVYRDFYISKGLEAGLRPGMIITVKRRQPLYDAIHNRSAGDLNIAVARVKIIHVEKGLAVARAYSDFGRDDLPLLEDNFIMIGDELDLSSATTESKTKDAKKVKTDKSAANEVSEPAEPAIEKPAQTAAIEPNDTAKPIDGPVVQ